MSLDKTSWSDEDLAKLCVASSHRVHYDGFGYIWQHNINGKWELHSVFKYREYSYYLHLIHYWIAKWGKELEERRKESNRKALRELRDKARIQRKVIKIQSYNDMGVKEKAQLLHELLPDEPQQYIADILDISRQAVSKHLK